MDISDVRAAIEAFEGDVENKRQGWEQRYRTSQGELRTSQGEVERLKLENTRLQDEVKRLKLEKASPGLSGARGTVALPPHGIHKASGRVLFTPTKQWREVPEGAICPAGLEFKMDVTTGKYQARLPPKATAKDGLIPSPPSGHPCCAR